MTNEIKTFYLVGGFPGSGKTTWAKKQIKNKNEILLDDCKKKDIPDKIKENIIYITNPNFCEESFRNEYIQILRKYYNDCVINFVMFENNPNDSLNNALNREIFRHGHSNGIENTFKRLKPLFSMPEDAVVLPVFKR